ncbi:MAG: ParB/RepB/Spo0J family partition protein, partial [Alphaproteobacteria bacterium]|nr:ParB/RepB/Spo0J family partition protein [Alphaproteobacteria bacterium]
GGAQMRVEMKPDVVRDYADDMAAGAVFPPVIVYHNGTDYWLGDGYHRVEAARKLERETIDAEVRDGDARQAILHGCGSNASHGLRRTQADKRRAIERLLRDDEWSKWSNRRIAKAAAVDHKTVEKVRRELLGGEFPTTPARPNGEIPGTNGKPNAAPPSAGGSVLQDMLRTVATEVLIEECERRGFKVEATDA